MVKGLTCEVVDHLVRLFLLKILHLVHKRRYYRYLIRQILLHVIKPSAAPILILLLFLGLLGHLGLIFFLLAFILVFIVPLEVLKRKRGLFAIVLFLGTRRLRRKLVGGLSIAKRIILLAFGPPFEEELGGFPVSALGGRRFVGFGVGGSGVRNEQQLFGCAVHVSV